MIFVVAHLALVFGSLAIVAMYLCGVALFAAQGPALATALPTVFNQMVFVQSRIAMLDICALTFALLGIAAFMHGFRKQRPDRQKRITTTSEISHSPDVTRTSQIGTNDPVRTCGLRLGEVRAQKDGFTTLRAILLLVSA